MLLYLIICSLIMWTTVQASGFLPKRSTNSSFRSDPVLKNLCSNPKMSREWENYKKNLDTRRTWNKLQEHNACIYFYKNQHFIYAHNQEAAHGKKKYWLQMNEFGTHDLQQGGCTEADSSIARTRKPSFQIKPTKSLNWSQVYRNSVGQVQHQGTCGSCWAFGVVTVLEGWYALKNNNKTIQLSTQQLVDCATPLRYRCRSGKLQNAFEYVKKFGGLIKAAVYPYTEKTHKSSTSKTGDYCRLNNEHNRLNSSIIRLDFTHHQLDKGEDELFKAVKNGPVVVSINTKVNTFKFYHKGIYDDRDCLASQKSDHAVAVVGFGYDSNQRAHYWIIKNSWGRDWGEQGYMRMAMNQNICGIGNGDGWFVSDALQEEKRFNHEKKVASSFGSGHKLVINHRLLCVIILIFHSTNY